MAIKTVIQELINSLIRTNTLIDKTEHADVEDALLLNSYGNIITDTQATTNVFTADDAISKQYNLKIVKQGRFVNISGTLTKNSVGIIELEYWCAITNSEYLPNNDHEFWGTLENGAPIRLVLYSTGQMLIWSPLGASEVINISTVYNTLS